ncbi:guanine nucleotide-binding protein subunit alpha [Termitomyces sp. Mi166|nr:guanine nucleotide-binding protein subunit alpha [Termitomyces sp. Mi166\
MGGCVSTIDREEKARSDAIDKQIEEDAKKYKRECKILLLGSGESGKSTIVKQMKIIHQNGFSQVELEAYRPVVYKNVLDSVHGVLVYMRSLRMDCASLRNAVLADKILAYRVPGIKASSTSHLPSTLGQARRRGVKGKELSEINPEEDEVFDDGADAKGKTEDEEEEKEVWFAPEIAEAIHQVWRDDTFQKIMDEHTSNFYLMDSASYFFSEILRIGTPGYIPNETDVLRARRKTFGISEERFLMGTLSIHMFDVGGQRSERKKWIHCFESVTSIIFCTALSEYDQVLLEEKSQNRMKESLYLFESVINSRWFLRTSMILFLNKIDVFKVKLPKMPLQKYFPEYTGGADINKAAKYVLWKFMQTNRMKLSVYPHLTQATDTQNIRLVFAAVKETILQNALKDSGIL